MYVIRDLVKVIGHESQNKGDPEKNDFNTFGYPKK
jgi:hypothetical protein